MNIFYLSSNPVTCAAYHCDKHVVKMVVESAQILSTACYIRHAWRSGMYMPTHAKHPCVLWASERYGHCMELIELFRALCNEYTFRYGKVHKSSELLPMFISSREVIYQNCGLYIGHHTPPPKCMPEAYRKGNTVTAYRRYYKEQKSHFARYTKRPVPSFMR